MEFSFFPRTWILPKQINDLKYTQEQAAKLNRSNKKTGFTMICKPDWLSQGKGIFITNEIEHVNN